MFLFFQERENLKEEVDFRCIIRELIQRVMGMIGVIFFRCVVLMVIGNSGYQQVLKVIFEVSFYRGIRFF